MKRNSSEPAHYLNVSDYSSRNLDVAPDEVYNIVIFFTGGKQIG